MKYVIDTKVVNKANLSLGEFLALLLLKAGNPKIIFDKLLKDNKIVLNGGNYIITQHWSENVDRILLDSDKTVPTESEMVALAEKLRAIFPDGKKADSPYYWKCNRKEVLDKLRSFYKQFGATYTEEEILDAARRYVKEYENDRTFMRLLKYFIWKNDGGELVSELASYIENKGQENENDNWTAQII